MDNALFEDYLKNDPKLSPNTVYLYRTMANAFMLTNPNLLNINDYNDYITKVSFKKRSYSTYYALKRYIEFKFEGKDNRPTKTALLSQLLKPRMPKGIKRERAHLDDETILKIISNMKVFKHRVIALIQKATGVRAGDVLRLPEGHIFLEKDSDGVEQLSIRIIGKGNKRHVVTIFNQDIKQVILNYTEGKPFNIIDGYYFLERQKGKNVSSEETLIYRNNYDKYHIDLKRAMNGVGVEKSKFSTHGFRHSFATKVWEKYKDLIVLQRVMNHEDPRTTIRYLAQSGLDNKEVYKEIQNQ